MHVEELYGRLRNAESAPGGAAVWGGVTGTLSDQTDLQSALDAKAASSTGVTNGNSHDHSGGDGAQIAYSGLSGLPTLATITAPAGSVDFNGQQALSFRIENRTSDPGTPATGQIWLRTDL